MNLRWIYILYPDEFKGSVTNPHGVKGLEHCHFLKTIEDAYSIRQQIINNLEHACLPTTSDEERRRLLSFVICGGGPTGVEFAAEVFDLLYEDLTRFFPKVLRNEVSVHLIQSRGHILNTYDEALSVYAEVGSDSNLRGLLKLVYGSSNVRGRTGLRGIV